MIGIDTNVLVRDIVQDDPKQSPRATRLVERLIERIAHAQGCQSTMTFDTGAVKAAGMTLVT